MKKRTVRPAIAAAETTVNHTSNADPAAMIKLGELYIDHRLDEKSLTYIQGSLMTSEGGRFIGRLALHYFNERRYDTAQLFSRQFEEYQLRHCNPVTRANYQKLTDEVVARGITMVCMQYPMRNIKPLCGMLASGGKLIFVDNERTFKDIVRESGYSEYFSDQFAGDFGHCTDKGNRLLAENIADAILLSLGN